VTERADDAQSEPEDDLSEYRKHLQTAEQRSQEDFDKTVLSLSGGGLGVSFIFLKDVIGLNPIVEPQLLFATWVVWGSSTFCVLASYYFSHLALRKAIKQIDVKTIRMERTGGWFRTATAILNAAGAILFLVGVCTITLFANANLKTKGETNVAAKGPSSSAPSSPASATATAPPISSAIPGTADRKR
jgi:hypothetical protein